MINNVSFDDVCAVGFDDLQQAFLMTGGQLRWVRRLSKYEIVSSAVSIQRSEFRQSAVGFDTIQSVSRPA